LKKESKIESHCKWGMLRFIVAYKLLQNRDAKNKMNSVAELDKIW